MEYSNCDEAPVSMSMAAIGAANCVRICALQQATSAQSLAASSCSCSTGTSTSTCTDFSSSEGGFDDSPADAAPTEAAAVAAAAAASAAAAAGAAAADTSVSLFSLTFDEQSARGIELSTIKASSALSLMPQQPQLPQLHPSLGLGCRPHRHQPQKQRRRSNAISAKSRSSYLAQYNESKCAYFDGVLAGDIPVNQASMAPKFN